jgi:hypothetical protein
MIVGFSGATNTSAHRRGNPHTHFVAFGLTSGADRLRRLRGLPIDTERRASDAEA